MDDTDRSSGSKRRGEESKTQVGFRPLEISDGGSITRSFAITVDDTTTFGPFEAEVGLHSTDVAFTGQIIRFDVKTSTGGHTGATDVSTADPRREARIDLP